MKVNILDFNDRTELESVNYFLSKSRDSVIQQYPLVKYLYTKDSERFFYLVCKDKDIIVGVLPFVIYFNQLGNIIQSCPILGYGGIVSEDCKEKNEIFKLLIDKMLFIGKEYNCIASTLGTSILDKNIDLYKNIYKPDFIKENFLQYNLLDDLPLNKLKSRSKSAIKSKINACRNNKNIKIVKNDERYFDEWYNIHCTRFKDITANPIPYNVLKNIKNNFVNNNAADFYYAFNNDELIGGIISIYNHNVVDYFASSFRTEFMDLNVNQLMLSEIHEWAISKKINVFNWESSPSKEGGVYEFKRRWGAEEGKHYYLTKILGNIDRLKLIDKNIIRREYSGYFLMPYEYLNTN
jgi:hypothetical protein